MIRFVFVVTFALTAVGHAQPSSVDPMTPSTPPPEVVSEKTALTLSLGGTVASYAMIGGAVALNDSQTAFLGTIGMVGTLVAPSFGHWYAGAWLTRGMGLRAGGLVVLVAGILADSEGCSLFYGGHGDPEPADCNESFRTTQGTVLILAGAAMFVGGTVDDIVTAPRRARRRNEAAAAQMQLSLAPIVRHDGGGLALAGSF